MSEVAVRPAPSPKPSTRRIADLPGPKGWPVLGNLLQLEPARLHLQLADWAAQFGRCYRVKLGPREILVVADHEAVAQVLRDRPDGFRRTERLEMIGTEMGLQPGLFGVNGDAWKRQRRMVMAAFDPGMSRPTTRRWCAAPSGSPAAGSVPRARVRRSTCRRT